MKQFGSIVLFFVLLFVYSKWGPSIPFSSTTQNKGEPLTVTETGKVAVVPDIAKITIGVEEQGQTLKQVQGSVNTKSKKLTEELKKLDIPEKNIKTVSYNVYPEYDYDVSPYKINGYRVSTSYEVKITDFEVVNDAIVIATNSGANILGNISFEVNDKTKEELTDKAREEATEKAKSKAKGLANVAGITLGRIINIQESGGFEPRPILMYDKAVSGSGPAMEANITPGETEIEVSITLSYEIR
jgi:hypothetical protein